jgi:hypothetical protein
MENQAFSVTVEQLSSAEGLVYGKEELSSNSCSQTSSRQLTHCCEVREISLLLLVA